jgi:dihydrofolate reductase
MRKLVIWNLMSLDGCLEGPAPWDLRFHETAWGEELDAFSLEQADEIGALLFGRVTYEGMAAYWSKETTPVAHFMNGVEKLVASRTLRSVSWNNSRLLDGEAAPAVAKLKQTHGKDIFVFGSGILTASLLEHGLVDEYRLCIAPTVIGGGAALFKPQNAGLRMKLLDARPLKTSAVILRYEPVKERRAV